MELKFLKNLLRFIAIIAAYYVMGRLGLLFAIAPSNASAIWPPSGLALAVVFLYGYRYAPAVFLGSFLANFQAYMDNSHDIFSYFAIDAGAIGLGASMQAIVGAFLIKRFVKLRPTLEYTKDLVLMMLLGGPVACMVSSTISITALLAHGTILWSDLYNSWLTWWTGDSLGVMIFTPLFLLLLQFDKTKVSIRRKVIVLTQLILLFPLVLFAFLIVQDFEQRSQKLDFESQAKKAVIQLRRSKLNVYGSSLNAIQLYNEGSNFLKNSEFKKFSGYYLKNFQGVSALQWVPKVSDTERKKFENLAHQEGLIGFQFIENNKRGEFITAKKRPEYFPIFYVEPFEGNEWMRGFDLSTQIVHAEAIERSGRSGEVSAISQVMAIPDQNKNIIKRPVILIYQPVYSVEEIELRNPEDRRQYLKGFVVGIFAVDRILQPIIDDFLEPYEIELQLYDIEESHKVLLYSNSYQKRMPNFSETSARDRLSWQQSFAFAGRIWQINFTQNYQYIMAHKSQETWLVLVCGLFLTSILGMLLLLITGRSDTVQRLVDEKVKEINMSKERSILLKSIAVEAVQATSTKQVLQTILDSICKCIEWPLGHAFLWDEKNGVLISSQIWHFSENSEKYQDFKNISEESSFRPGEGLPGLVMQQKKPVYIDNIENSDYLSRRSYLQKVGIHSAFALPILVKNKVEAVVEFFSPTTLEENDQLIDFVELVCIQLGRVIERKQIENIKNEFISMVSHELRTPLTSIRGTLGLIVGGVAGEVPKKIADLINIADQNSQRLTHIINDILSIEKIESGKMEIKPQVIDAAEFLRKTVEANQFYGARSQIRFEVKAIPDNVKIFADPDRLMQVMANLLSNAAKFSPVAGTVNIGAEMYDEKYLRFYVQDFGPGIPQNFRSRIFEKFAQADSSDTKNNYQGTGLGLSITRKLVEMMNGKIGFESEVGKGATFYFDLPIAD